VSSNVTITGTLARFGRSGMIKDVANLLMGQFATCVEGKLGREVLLELRCGRRPPLSRFGGTATRSLSGR
jgi:hypothetical protein